MKIEQYTKKELHEFIDSIDWSELQCTHDYLAHLKEYPNTKMVDPKVSAHQRVTSGSIRSKYELCFSYMCMVGDEKTSRNVQIDKFMLKYGLDRFDEYKKHKLCLNPSNNNKYINQMCNSINKRLPNLSVNKAKQLEQDVVRYIVDTGGYNYSTREHLAMLFNVRLKYIDRIFQKLMRSGVTTKMSGRTSDAWHDNERHSTFYHHREDKIKLMLKDAK